MSEKIWTAAQSAAIDFSGGNLILSAGAGSGKTATLTERIIRTVISGGDLSRMLIVTFTKAAAGELKMRITSALEKAIAENPADRHVRDQLYAIDSAHISTIDSFFLETLRPHFSSLGLPPDFSVIDDADADTLKAEAMSDTVDELFAHPSGDGEENTLLMLADCLSGTRDEASLDKTLLSFRDMTASRDTSPEDLRQMAEKCRSESGDFLTSGFAAPLREHMRLVGEHYVMIFSTLAEAISAVAETEKYTTEAYRCLSLADEMGVLADKSFSEAYDFFTSFEAGRLSPLKGELQTDDYLRFKDERKHLFDAIRSIGSTFFEPGHEKACEAMKRTADIVSAAADVLDSFEKRFGALKRERGKVDFNDLERFATKIFTNPDGSPTQAALDAGAKFERIFIDEYQDTSAAQDRVFSAIGAVTPRFMVGDVKQSIYGFRGACPDLFTAYRRAYENGDGGNAVFMSENFRSDSSIIDFANIVSAHIFSAGAAPFEEADKLIPAKKCAGEVVPVKLCLIGAPQVTGTMAGARDCEAEYVAAEAARLIREERLADGRKITPGDITVLLRSGTRAPEFASALTARGIPVQNSATEHFFSYGEVLLMLCLLKSCDNPLSDIYLAGAMKSPLCGFTLDELVNLRGGDRDPLWYSLCRYAESGENQALREKCAGFEKRLNGWREAAVSLYADEIMRMIISDTGILRFSSLGDRSADDVRRSVKIMMDHAVGVAFRGGGLHDFTAYLDRLIEKSDKVDFVPDGGKATVMTIHKSKGLEFPVCFIAGASQSFNTRDASDNLLFDKACGPAMKLYDDNGLVRCDTPLRQSLALKLRHDNASEEARVFYVALTRPTERLYITCAEKDCDKAIADATERAEHPASRYSVLNSGSFARWITDAAVRSISKAPGCFEILKKDGGEILADAERQSETAPAPDTSEDGEYEKIPPRFDEIFTKTIDFVSGREYLEDIPAKLTVSHLSPDVLNIAGEERMTVDRAPAPKTAVFARPSFLADEKPHTAADAGTATHIFMQFCDFAALRKNGAESELCRLRENGFISVENASLVRLSEIELFRSSTLLGELLDARKIYREQRFNAVLPAWRFTTDDALREKLRLDKTEITVQGVVDCMYVSRSGKTYLVDYKTDRLTRSQMENRADAETLLISRHKRQLSIYRAICSGMLGTDFDKVYIYSLPLGDVIEIPPAEDGEVWS